MEELEGERNPLLNANRTNLVNTKFRVICKRVAGLMFAILSSFLYSVLTLISKILLEFYHPLTISLWRFEATFLPSIPVIALYASLPSTKLTGYAKSFGIGPEVWGITGCTSTVLYIYAVDMLTIGDAAVIAYSYPVIVTLLAHCILGEKADCSSILIAILSFVGIIIISRPPILTGQSNMDQNTFVGVLFALGSMVLLAFNIITLRLLRSVHCTLVTLSFGLIGTIECAILAAAQGVLVYPQRIHEWILAASLLLFSFLQMSFVALALKLEKAAPVSLVLSTDIVFSFILQFVFLGVVPDKYSLIGAAIVLLGVSLTTIRKWKETPTTH